MYTNKPQPVFEEDQEDSKPKNVGLRHLPTLLWIVMFIVLG
jgi:hypothetical protein